MFNNNKINNSRYVKNARDAHIAFGANPALSPKYTEAARPLTAPFTNDRLYLIRECPI